MGIIRRRYSVSERAARGWNRRSSRVDGRHVRRRECDVRAIGHNRTLDVANVRDGDGGSAWRRAVHQNRGRIRGDRGRVCNILPVRRCDVFENRHELRTIGEHCRSRVDGSRLDQTVVDGE